MTVEIMNKLKGIIKQKAKNHTFVWFLMIKMIKKEGYKWKTIQCYIAQFKIRQTGHNLKTGCNILFNPSH